MTKDFHRFLICSSQLAGYLIHFIISFDCLLFSSIFSEENGGFGAPKETEETPAENVEQTPETE